MPVEVALGPVDFYDHDLRECFSSFPCPTDRRKLLLPKLGGTPQVWNTCMVFFQTTLLAGYLLAHWSVRRNVSTWLHPLLLLGSIATLPLSFARTPVATDQPAMWLFVELVRVAGLPV